MKAEAAKAQNNKKPAAPLPLDLQGAEAKLVQENVILLQRLLSDAILYLDGEEGARLYQRALEAQPEDLHKLTTHEAIYAARALACLATFSNISEDVAGRRRHADITPGSDENRPQDLAGAANWLKANGVAEKDLVELYKKLRVVPVLTAHPTEMRRRSVMEREHELARVLQLRLHRPSKAAEGEMEADPVPLHRHSLENTPASP